MRGERDSLNTGIRSALEELGNPAKLDNRIPISYPRVLGQDDETEMYKWFVSNDYPKNGRTEALQPVVIDGNVPPKIQPLPRLPAPRNR